HAVLGGQFGAGATLDVPLSTFTAEPGVWDHIAFTYDDSTGTQTLYVNGVSAASGTAGLYQDTITYAANPLLVGAELVSGNRTSFFDGMADEVSAWSVVRTQGEIADNMSVALAGTETGLQLYYRFNEGSGATTSDLAGADNPGTLGNGTPGNAQAPIWLPSTAPTSKSKIELIRPGPPDQSLAAGTPNDGSFPWTIPAAPPPATQATHP